MTFNFNPDSPGAAYRYYSTLGYVWLVPRTALSSVGVDKLTRKPVHVNYPTKSYYMPIKCFRTLDGLCQDDLKDAPAELVIYQLANGQLLAANKEAIAKANLAIHRKSNTTCLKHQVSDLELSDQLPASDSNFDPDQYDYEQAFG